MGLYWLSALIGCLFALLLTPLVRPLALRFNAFDRPNRRTIHVTPLPRIGGVAIFSAFVVTVGLLLVFNQQVRGFFYFDPYKSTAFFVSLLLIFGLGVYDDLRGLNAPKKFTVQFIASSIVYAAGFRIDVVGWLWGGTIDLGPFGYPLTILWIVGITNALNLIDGLDGLAAGVSAIASATICVIALHFGNSAVAFATAVLTGVLLGFLRYNFHPAKLFMGDSGSLLLGFFLATMALQGVQKGSTAVALFLPIVVMAVPIADTLMAMARRALNGNGMFTADREHFHHRLIWKGLNQVRAVFCLYAVSAACSVAALMMTFGTPGVSWAAVLTVLSGGVLLIRQLEYVEFDGIMGRILRGDRRSRSPRYKNLVLKKVQARISDGSCFEKVWRSMTMAAKELEFDYLHLTPTAGRRLGTFGAVEWKSRSCPNGRPDCEPRLWTRSYPVHDRQSALRLTVGKYAWKRRRRGEEDELWGRELAGYFEHWLARAGSTAARRVEPETDSEVLPPLVIPTGSIDEIRQPTTSA